MLLWKAAQWDLVSSELVLAVLVIQLTLKPNFLVQSQEIWISENVNLFQ